MSPAATTNDSKRNVHFDLCSSLQRFLLSLTACNSVSSVYARVSRKICITSDIRGETSYKVSGGHDNEEQSPVTGGSQPNFQNMQSLSLRNCRTNGEYTCFYAVPLHGDATRPHFDRITTSVHFCLYLALKLNTKQEYPVWPLVRRIHIPKLLTDLEQISYITPMLELSGHSAFLCTTLIKWVMIIFLYSKTCL